MIWLLLIPMSPIVWLPLVFWACYHAEEYSKQREQMIDRFCKTVGLPESSDAVGQRG